MVGIRTTREPSHTFENDASVGDDGYEKVVRPMQPRQPTKQKIKKDIMKASRTTIAIVLSSLLLASSVVDAGRGSSAAPTPAETRAGTTPYVPAPSPPAAMSVPKLEYFGSGKSGKGSKGSGSAGGKGGECGGEMECSNYSGKGGGGQARVDAD